MPSRHAAVKQKWRRLNERNLRLRSLELADQATGADKVSEIRELATTFLNFLLGLDGVSRVPPVARLNSQNKPSQQTRSG